MIPLVRYQMYYNKKKQKYCRKYQQNNKNIENKNTNNDTFIDRNPISLASSRRKSLAK
jgi:hypothetical protein